MLLHERLLRSVAATAAVGVPSLYVASTVFGHQSLLPTHRNASAACSATATLGRHCFPDYIAAGSSAAPAIRLLHEITVRVGAWTHLQHVGLLCWLLLVLVCALTPILWATRPAPAQSRAVEVLLFGVATVPLLVSLDLGNPAPLALPPLLWVGVSFARGRTNSAVVAMAVASLFNPPFVLLSALFLFRKDWRNTVRALVASVVALFFGAAATLGLHLGSYLSWLWAELPVSAWHMQLNAAPQNVGSARSAVVLIELIWTRALGREPQAATQVFRADRLPMQPLLTAASTPSPWRTLAVLAFVLALAALVYLRGKRLSRYAVVVLGCAAAATLAPIARSQELVYILVPVAVLLRTPHAHLEFFDAAPFWLERTTQFVFVLAMTLSLVPAALPLQWLIPHPVYTNVNLMTAMAGPAWMMFAGLLVTGLLLPQNVAVRTGWRARSAPRRK